MEQHEQVFARRFLLRELLGKGAYGSVYRAWDQHAEREVALKIVSLEGRANAERTAARFEREGQVTAALTHPGIVRVHSQGREGIKAWLAYELVPGARDLGKVLRERDLRGRVELIADAADALAYAHARGVVHRDVKPENILVDGEGRVRVADFGLAAAQGLDRLTKTGAVMGTPLYMSPEQFGMGGMGEVAAPTDVWALGVILYEALTDRVPFKAPGLWELGAQVMNEPPTRPRSIRSDVPRDLEAVCLKALRREPGERYADAGGLAEDLRRWLLGDSVVGARLRLWDLLPRRVRSLCLAAVPALLAALVVLSHDPKPPPAPAPVAAVGTRARAASALPRWRPKVGDMRWKTLGWEQQQEGGGFALDALVELRLEERVEAVSGGRATLKAKVDALRLQIGDVVRFDSCDPTGNMVRIEGIVGSSFTYEIELATLRLLGLQGSDMGSSARSSLAAVENLSGSFLDQLGDERIARHVGTLYSLNPPPGASDRWENLVEVWPRPGVVIRQRCAFERSGLSVTGKLLEASTETPAGSEVPSGDVRLAVEGRLADDGLLDTVWLTTSYRETRKGQTAHMRWRMYVRSEDGPLGEVPQLEAGVSEFVSPESRAEAYLELGYRSYHQGDPEKAIRCYLLSARGGSTRGMLALGTAYERGTGTRKDPHKALEWFMQAAEHGHPEGFSRVGRVYYNGGPGLPSNPRKAVEYFQQAIRAGDSRGWEYMGLAHREGHGMPRDPIEARRCLRRAAEKDNPDAMTNLAEMLVKGEGGPVDLDEAERLLKETLKLFPDENRGIRARTGLKAIAKLRAERGR